MENKRLSPVFFNCSHCGKDVVGGLYSTTTYHHNNTTSRELICDCGKITFELISPQEMKKAPS